MSDNVLLGLFKGNFYSAKDILENLFWPTSIIPLPDLPILEECGVIDFELDTSEENAYLIKFVVIDEISFQIEEIGPEIVFFSGNQGLSIIDIEFKTEPQLEVTFTTRISILFPPSLLRPAVKTTLDETDKTAWSKIDFDTSIAINSEGRFIFKPIGSVSLSKSLIGNTNICIEASEIDIGIFEDPSVLRIGQLSIILPEELSGLPDLITQDAIITRNGLSANFTAEWEVKLDPSNNDFVRDRCGLICTLFNEIDLAINKISIVIDQNLPVAISIEGAMKFPFFEKIIEVELSLGEGGTFLIALKGAGNGEIVSITKDQLFSLDINSCEFTHTAELTAFTLDGDLSVMSNIIPRMPKLTLNGLTIFKADNGWGVRLKGGKIPLKKTIDLFGFKAEINNTFIGDVDGIPYLFFDARIQLLDGIDLAAWVDGLAIPLDGSGSVRLNGAGLQVASPVFQFSGNLTFETIDDTRIFRGGISLYLVPLGLGIESQIMIAKGVDCTGAYIYLKVIFPPPGFPFGNIPLYLRACEGLVGIHATLNASSPHEMLSLRDKPQIGFFDASKYKLACGQHVIGLGVEVAVASEILFNMSAALIFLFPDFTFILTGKAFVLQKPMPGKEAPFYSTIILQTDPFAALINVSAKYEFLKGVLKAEGTLEAYYGPDPQNENKTTWYFALGQVKPYFPVNKPISIEVLKIFEARGYFIVMPELWEIGQEINFGKEYSFAGIVVKFRARIGGVVTLYWDPLQVKGFLELDGNVVFRFWGIGFDISLYASLLAMAPDYLIDAMLRFGVTINLLFKKITFGGEFHLHWEKRKVPPIPEAFEKVKLIHVLEDKTWDPLIGEAPALVTDIPSVGPDSHPVVSFIRTKDVTGLPFCQDVQNIKPLKSGDYEFRSKLKSVRMWRCQIDDYDASNEDVWTEFINPLEDTDNETDTPRLFGAWLEVEDAEGVIGANILQLFARTPCTYDRNRVIDRNEGMGINGKSGFFKRTYIPIEDQPRSGGIEAGESHQGTSPSGGVECPVTPVSPLDGYTTEINEEAESIPYRSAQVLEENEDYPYSGKDDVTDTYCINFFQEEIQTFSPSNILEIGRVKISSNQEFSIKQVDFTSLPLKYLETKQSALLLGFDKPIIGCKINTYIKENSHQDQSTGTGNNSSSRETEINSTSNEETHRAMRYHPIITPVGVGFFLKAFKREDPEQDLWDFNNLIEVPITMTPEEHGAVKILVDNNNLAPNDPSHYDLLIMGIGAIKLLSICFDVDKREERENDEQQTRGFIDSVWRGSENETGVSGPISDLPARLWDGVITPGYVYRLNIETEVSRENGTDIASKTTTNEVLFKVVDPPSTLEPYVLRTFPKFNGYPHYRSHPWFVRFIKNYIHKLFLVDPIWNLINDNGLDIDFSYQDENMSWEYGLTPDHVFTNTELIFQKALNDSVPEEEKITDEMIVGDEIMWMEKQSPIITRVTFEAEADLTSYFNIPIRPDNIPCIAQPWSITEECVLKHVYIEEDETINDPESFLLLKGIQTPKLIFNTWLRDKDQKGETGFVLFYSVGVHYLKIILDCESRRVSLVKERTLPDQTRERVILVDKQYGIPKEKWTNLRVTLNEIESLPGDKDLNVSLDEGPYSIFSVRLGESELGGIIDTHQGNIGFYATKDFIGEFDNFEIRSISILNQTPSAEAKHHFKLVLESQELYKFDFQTSKYIDFFDHMNSWNRIILRAASDSQYTENQDSINESLKQWNTYERELCSLKSQYLADEDDLFFGRLNNADLYNSAEASLGNTSRALYFTSYELDRHFTNIAETLGFNTCSQVRNIEIQHSSDRLALFIISPDPIDWTRISIWPITQIKPSRIAFETKVIYSSDMTQAVVLLKNASSDLTTFNVGQYLWRMGYNVCVPPYLNWIKDWLLERKEHYVFTLEFSED